MRLCLDDLGPTRPPATETELPGGSLVINAPPLTLVLAPLTVLAALAAPGDLLAVLAALATELVSRDCPPGCSVRVVPTEPAAAAERPPERPDIHPDLRAATVFGWPLQLVHAQVLGPDGTVREERLGAVYQFLRYTTSALIRFPGRPDAPWLPPPPRLVQLLRSGRPDWRAGNVGTVAALWDIWHEPTRF